MNDQYFNAEFKSQYLYESKVRNSNVDLTVDLLFRRIAPTERRLGKDLYNFTVTEILGYYKYLSTPSLESLMIMNNQYKLYTAYALKEGLVKDNQNHYAEIDNNILMTCVNVGWVTQRIITRQELLDILNSSNVENVSDKVIALGIFEGIWGKELSDLTSMKPTDINTETKTIKLLSGREFKISDQLIAWCLESADEYEFFNSMNKVNNKKYLETDTRVIKRLSNSTVDSMHQRHKTVNRRLDHLINCTGCPAFTVHSLKESGRLEMIRNMRKAGMSLEMALRDPDMLYRYGYIPSLKRYCLKFGLE